MASRHIDPSTLTLFILPDGCVALESTALTPVDNLDLFGDGGAVPPVSLSDMIDACMKLTKAVPDDTDTADLRRMASALKASLAQVETTLARLEAKSG